MNVTQLQNDLKALISSNEASKYRRKAHLDPKKVLLLTEIVIATERYLDSGHPQDKLALLDLLDQLHFQ
jgi:hypothetical protein